MGKFSSWQGNGRRYSKYFLLLCTMEYFQPRCHPNFPQFHYLNSFHPQQQSNFFPSSSSFVLQPGLFSRTQATTHYLCLVHHRFTPPFSIPHSLLSTPKPFYTLWPPSAYPLLSTFNQQHNLPIDQQPLRPLVGLCLTPSHTRTQKQLTYISPSPFTAAHHDLPLRPCLCNGPTLAIYAFLAFIHLRFGALSFASSSISSTPSSPTSSRSFVTSPTPSSSPAGPSSSSTRSSSSRVGPPATKTHSHSSASKRPSKRRSQPSTRSSAAPSARSRSWCPGLTGGTRPT